MIESVPPASDRFAHLLPEVRPLLAEPLPLRIERIRTPVWLDYPLAKEAVQRLDDLLGAPPDPHMESLLIVGESDNGKSSILERFRNLKPPTRDQHGRVVASPVLIVPMPSLPKEERFWSAVLTALDVPHNVTAPPARLLAQAYIVLRHIGCKLILIDDVNNASNGAFKEQRHFLTVLKNLSIQLRLPIAAAGTEAALQVFGHEEQLGTRFEPFVVRRWKLDREFQQLVAAFERVIPLAEPSNLSSREFALKLYTRTNGTIGSLRRLLRKAAVAAVRSGSERITPELIDSLNLKTMADYRNAMLDNAGARV